VYRLVLSLRTLIPAVAGFAIMAGLLTQPVGAQAPFDPPGTGLILGQLRTWFANWDINKDGYLTKDELAKAFRGPYARPFDANAKNNNAAKTVRPTYENYPDYQFLVQLDKNGDERVSREEFEAWARDYAAYLVRLQEMDNYIRQLQLAMLMQQGYPANPQQLTNQQQLANQLAQANQARANLKATQGLGTFDASMQKVIKTTTTKR
jgi:hypothetical protein